MSALLNRVGSGSLVAFIVYGSSAGVAAVAQIFLARVVGAESYGVYSYVLAWMSALGYFAALGFDVALLRYIPAYQASDAWPLVRGVVQYAHRRSLAAAGLIIPIGLIIVLSVSDKFSTSLRNTFLIGFALVPMWALLWIRCSIVRAYGGVAWALIPDRIVRDGVVILAVALAKFGLGHDIDAPFVMIATLAGSAIGLLSVSVALRIYQHPSANAVEPAYVAQAWRASALPLMVLGAAEIFMNRSGTLLLGWAGDAKGAGIYSLVFNIAFLMTLPRTAINTLFAPTISALYSRGENEKMQDLLIRSALWSALGAAAIGAALFLGYDVLIGFFSKDFHGSKDVFFVLAIGQLLAMSAGSHIQLMTMTGSEITAATLLVVSALCNLVAGLALFHIFGVLGVAIASSASFVLWHVLTAFYVRRRLGLMPGILALVLRGRLALGGDRG